MLFFFTRSARTNLVTIASSISGDHGTQCTWGWGANLRGWNQGIFLLGELASITRMIRASSISLHTFRASEQERAGVARARRRSIRKQGLLDPARLVFIDETATSTSLVRLRGRCPRGERLVGSVPHGHWKTITLVVGLRYDGMVAPFVIDGPMNGTIFLAYVEQCLAPTLDRRDVVIMDNLPAHKVAGVTDAIEAVGATQRRPGTSSPH